MSRRRMERVMVSLALALTTLCPASLAGASPIPGTVTLADSAAGGPTVAVDGGTRTVYIAWVGAEDSVRNVYLSRSERGGGFGQRVRVNDLAGDVAFHEEAPAQVAVGPEGNVYVAWINQTVVVGRRFPASDVRLARSTDGGRTFDRAVTVNDDAKGHRTTAEAGGMPASHHFHHLAVAPDGAVYVSWLDSREADRARAQGGTGDAHGHHGGGSSPGSEVRVARSGDGGRTFGGSAVVDRGVCPCCRTALAAGPGGRVYAAWRTVYAGDVRDIAVARSEDGGRTFSTPSRVHADGWVIAGCPHNGPSLGLDGEGRLHVAWYTGQEGRQGVYLTVSGDGGRTFGTPESLSGSGEGGFARVKVCADGAGGLWAAWEGREGGERVVRAGRVLDGGEPERAFAGASPAVAAGGGVRAVAWLDGRAVRIFSGPYQKP